MINRSKHKLNFFENLTDPMRFGFKTNPAKKIANFISNEIEWIPLNSIDNHNEKKDLVIEFLDSLEDDDDVQNVFSNVNLEVN